MEHFFKSVFQGSEISCKPPDEYFDRFCYLVKSLFKDEDDINLTNSI